MDFLKKVIDKNNYIIHFILEYSKHLILNLFILFKKEILNL